MDAYEFIVENWPCLWQHKIFLNKLIKKQKKYVKADLLL